MVEKFLNCELKKNFMAFLCEWGLTASRLQNNCEKTVYFYNLSLQKFLVLIGLTLEGRKTGSPLESPSGFDPKPLD